MAIDSALKRASAVADQFTQMLPPEPSGSIGAPERAIVVWAYSGLSYEAPVTPEDEPGIIAYARASQVTSEQARMSGGTVTASRVSGSGTAYSR